MEYEECKLKLILMGWTVGPDTPVVYVYMDKQTINLPHNEGLGKIMVDEPRRRRHYPSSGMQYQYPLTYQAIIDNLIIWENNPNKTTRETYKDSYDPATKECNYVIYI